MAEALEHNRRSGFPAYAAYMRAHDGWFARLAGDLDAAVRVGRQALASSSPVEHPWWYATAAGLLAATLLEARAADAEAERVARRALAGADAGTAPAGRLRCAAALALATGDGTTDRRGSRAAGRGRVPARAGLGGRAPTATCRWRAAALGRGDGREAARLLEPLRAATETSWPARADSGSTRSLAQSSSTHQLSGPRGAVRRAPRR